MAVDRCYMGALGSLVSYSLSDLGEMTPHFHLGYLFCETGKLLCVHLVGDGVAQLICMCRVLSDPSLTG